MHHAFKIGVTEINVELSRARDGYRLHVGDKVIAVDLRTGADKQAWLTFNGETLEVVIATHGDDVFVHLDGETHQLRYEHPLQRLAEQAHGSAEDVVLAPMPGSLVSLTVKPGDSVSKGQVLLVMESMKMETTLHAARDGVVATVNFEKGQTFDRDAVLLTLEPVGAGHARDPAEESRAGRAPTAGDQS